MWSTGKLFTTVTNWETGDTNKCDQWGKLFTTETNRETGDTNKCDKLGKCLGETNNSDLMEIWYCKQLWPTEETALWYKYDQLGNCLVIQAIVTYQEIAWWCTQLWSNGKLVMQTIVTYWESLPGDANTLWPPSRKIYLVMQTVMTSSDILSGNASTGGNCYCQCLDTQPAFNHAMLKFTAVQVSRAIVWNQPLCSMYDCFWPISRYMRQQGRVSALTDDLLPPLLRLQNTFYHFFHVCNSAF